MLVVARVKELTTVVVVVVAVFPVVVMKNPYQSYD